MITPLSEALRVEHNLALSAGAGTGKTYSLVTMALHVLGGARAGHTPVRSKELVMLTFTEKAAGEMRSRLEARVARLATPRAPGRETTAFEEAEADLLASYAAIGQPLPDCAFWRDVLDELSAASVSTFHAHCLQLLKRAPPDAGVPVAVTLADPAEATRWFSTAALDAVLSALERRLGAVEELVSRRGLAQVVSRVVSLTTTVAEEGVDFRRFAPPPHARAGGVIEQEARRAAETVRLWLGTFEDDAQVAAEALVARLGSDDGAALSSAWEELEALARRLPHRGKIAAARQAVIGKSGSPSPLALAVAAELEFHLTAALHALMDDTRARYEQTLARHQALDFNALLSLTRQALLNSPHFRAEVQGGVRVLLVDEFQDTNLLQLDIVRLLSERRDGAPRDCADPAELPIQPAMLGIVGDAKQAIYEFRGADVTLFETFGAQLEASGGVRANLTSSRRSRPRLLDYFNAYFPRALPVLPGRPAYDVGFAAGDALTPTRPEIGTAPRVLQLKAEDGEQTPTEERVLQDATAVARYLGHALSHRLLKVSHDDLAPPVPARPRDVVLLFSRFTNVQTYSNALAQAGIRHRVFRGRGFFATPEVRDVAQLLQLLVTPDEPLSLAAILRSPLIGLSDASLLNAVLEGRLSWAGVAAAPLAPDERAAVDAFRERFVPLSAHVDRLDAAAMFHALAARFSLRPLYAGLPFGEAAVDHLERLARFLELRVAAGRRSVASAARELVALGDDDRLLGPGELPHDDEVDAVTLITMHQAKGLEWPVVVLPELFAGSAPMNAFAYFSRTQGLAVRPRTKLNSEFAGAVFADLSQRAAAERRRLHYVAMTRARDVLILGLSGKKKPESVHSFLEEPAVAALVESVETRQLPTITLAPPAPRIDATHLAAVISRHEARRPLLPSELTLSVSALQDFELCRQRYWLKHVAGVSEPDSWRPITGDDEPGRGGARELGTAAHRLLELTPLELVGRKELTPALEDLARAEGMADAGGAIAMAERFWSSAFGTSVARAPPERVGREVDFARYIDGTPAVSLRGKIDLVVELEGTTWVVDYKTTRNVSAGAEPYRFQLGAYAAAVSPPRDSALVKSAIVFLSAPEPAPVSLRAGLERPDEVRARIARLGAEIASAEADRLWPRAPKTVCESISCPFVARCHGQT